MKFTTAVSSLLVISQAQAFSTSKSNIRSFDRQTLRLNLQNAGSENDRSLIDSSLNSASIADAPMDISLEEEKKFEETKSYLDDGFVFGLEGSGLSRPKGKVAQVVVEGDSTETQPYQVAFVSATFATHAALAINAISQLSSINHGNVPVTIAETAATLLSSWVLSDLGSGIFHWSVDNYGNGRTPVMGSLIAAFQGHHSAPWTITERGFCNNVWKLCIPFGVPTIGAIALLAGPSHPMVTFFSATFCALVTCSQEFHKWSHMTPSQLNPLILGLQDKGLTLGRVAHANHHIAPFDGNYCIISGACNKALDESGFLRRLEKIIYDNNGVESNAWKLDPELRAKTLRGDYSL